MALPATSDIQLNRRDWRLILIAVAVAAISLVIVSRYFHRAFPEASIDFQISGAGSAPVGERFLAARGLSTSGFRHAEQFDYDDDAKTFLERELGLERAEALLRARIPLWRWENRWFKPLTREEFAVSVSTAGPVVGFDHSIADDAPGASLSEAAARVRAQQFLSQVMHQDWTQWVPVGAARQQRPHRADYTFTWKEAAPLEPGATGYIAQTELRHEVRVQGAEVGSYQVYLKIPDAWTRSYSQLRSKNDSAGEVDTALLLALAVGMIFILVMRIRRADIRWRLALWVGGAGLVLSFLASLNSMGMDIFNYDTTQSWSAFLAGNLFGDLASAVGYGLLLLILTAAAESLYRERFPEKVAVGNFLSWRGVRSKSFLLSMVLGLGLAAFFFAYQTVFYLIANHFGAWAPADIPYDDLLNTKLPWAFVLFSGFFPAISEEFGFRMLAIPLFEKWFRYLWVAVIAASFLWGFGHATYPNQPFYIRGLEVGLGGLLLSWIMIRFGILATVVWHYTVDALYTAMLLLRAHDLYLRLSGATTALLALLPLAIAVIAYARHHGFAAEAALTNAAEGSAAAEVPPAAAAATIATPAAAAAPSSAPTYQPIPGPNWTTGIIVAGALLSAFAVPVGHWSTVLPWRTDHNQAIASARAFLGAQGWDTATDKVAATLETAFESGHGEENQIAAADLFTRRGQRPLLDAFSGPEPTVAAAYWHVRFFRALQKEEFNLAVRADTGQVTAFSHTQAETAPGASPSLAQAQQTATAFLAVRGIAVGAMAIKTAEQQVRPARTDSTFVWEATAVPASPLPGELAYRVEADLNGSQIAFFDAWYHVPEARVRQFEQATLAGTLLGVLKGLLYAAAAVLVFGLLFRFARQRALRWSTLLKISIAAGVLLLLISANALPSLLAAYPTDTPWSAFVLSSVIGLLVAALGGFLLTLALLAPLAITAPHTTTLTVANARRQLEHETAWDALWAGIMGLAWLVGWDHVRALVNARWHAAGSPPLPSPPAGLTHWLPGLSDALVAPLHALWIAAGLGILLPVLLGAWRNPKHRPWCVAGVALLWIGTFPAIHHAQQFALAAIFSLVTLVLLFGFGRLFLRDNPFAYVTVALLGALVPSAADWFSLPLPHTRLIGAILLALALAWLLWLALLSRPAPAARPS